MVFKGGQNLDFVLEGINLVVLFKEPGKHTIRMQKMVSLFPDAQTPTVIWPPDPFTPGIIEYVDKGLTITLVDNRLQIQSSDCCGEIPSYFAAILKDVLEGLGERDIKAYGFNFDFACFELGEIKEVFEIRIKTTSFHYKPGAFLKLTFERDKRVFIFELSDGHPSSHLHINVHHEEVSKTNLLANDIDIKLEEDFKAVHELIEEVLAYDKQR